MSRAPKARAGVAALAVCLCLGATPACTAARDTLGTNSSPCFRALAIAQDAVHDRGTFAGVRLEAVSALKSVEHVAELLKSRSSTPLRNLCVVSYRGTFRRSEVARPAGRVPESGTGRFAIVVISTPQNKLLATFVLEREPVRFRHLTLRAPTGAHPSGSGAA